MQSKIRSGSGLRLQNGDQSIDLNGLKSPRDDGVEHTIGEDYVLEPWRILVLGRRGPFHQW